MFTFLKWSVLISNKMTEVFFIYWNDQMPSIKLGWYQVIRFLDSLKKISHLTASYNSIYIKSPYIMYGDQSGKTVDAFKPCLVQACGCMFFIFMQNAPWDLLTHWSWDKMATIFQITFSNAFSWMIMYKFWLRFHWSLFPMVQLTIFHHWFREWLGADQATSHNLNH